MFARLNIGKDKYLNNEIDWWNETQSARGENQNRPGSSYGSGGPVGGNGPSAPVSTTSYPGQPEGSAPILSPPGIEASDHDNGTFGNVYPTAVGVGHNGAGGESY